MIRKAKEVLNIEADAIKGLIKHLDDNFSDVVNMITASKGRLIFAGMGKPGFIAQKVSATFASTGVPSIYLHTAEALHGDIGRVTKDDVIIICSNSGETEEVVKLLPILKRIKVKIVAMTGNINSNLAKNSDFVLNTHVKKEACPLGLAPTASTTAMLALGDALAVAVLEKRGLKKEGFAFYHPAGSLGKRLLLVAKDVMRKGSRHPIVKENELVKKVLVAITKARAGSATVVDKKGKLVGIFTDGDLRRHIKSNKNLLIYKVKDVMTKNPVTVDENLLAAEVLNILQSRKIDEVPVIDKEKKPVGLVDVQDILEAGII